MKERTLLAAVAVCAASLVPLACGSKQNPENGMNFQAGMDGNMGTQPTNTYPTATQPTPTATQPTPTATQPTPTATQPTPTATSTTVAAQPFDPAVATMIRTQLAPLAQQHAKGMRPEGDMVGASLNEGQVIEQQIMLNPGKCYTVIAVGLPMLQEVDIALSGVAPVPGAPALPLAADMGTGTTAILGDSPNCYKYALPLPAMAKITVKATKGSGAVGAQLYVK